MTEKLGATEGRSQNVEEELPRIPQTEEMRRNHGNIGAGPLPNNILNLSQLLGVKPEIGE